MRFRDSGLCLVMLKPDGTVGYADHQAADVLPTLRHSRPQLQRVRPAVLWTCALPITAIDGQVNICEPLPGTIMAAFAYIERRQLQAIVVLVGRSESFKLDKHTQDLLHQLGLDAEWLRHEAAKTPAFDNSGIQHEARQLANMLRDQLRLSGLEREVESLSGQLANTYEELSLIYRLSGGMKVNRSAGEFFKQACLDVMDVINIRGMGVVLRADSLEARDPVLYRRA